ncbi:PstS family phosphate ABC transporter substrate-binding protein [Massilia cavernae]|uniref:Phosphate ABC transporter substrate-binding protein, PhoT family n=1 Tax=Massilia cavernae TaxID=2320864 RepID=A0A418XFN1_9BURK|nr:substrate-binding domain-containing protein [Massilia cavernae]RJG11274.1 phosphate ABC transporter substrate-binding protein, PhoT family [Massilia cavernae]
MKHSIRTSCLIGLAAVSTLLVTPAAFALKYAAPEHKLQVDPKLPVWKPGPITINPPEEEFHLVGADVMDEITFGWAKMFRKAYAPKMSVTVEARASGAGAGGLIDGAHAAPVGREMLPAEEKAFVEKFGYKPTAIRVATGSVGSLGKTATSVIFVDKDNPLKGLTLEQLDAVYSKTRLRGYKEINTWGDLGLAGEWANRPVRLYGLKAVNGIEQFIKYKAMEGGEYKDSIEMVKGKGFVHAFNVAAEDMAKRPGGLTYALLANKTPNVRVVPLAARAGDPYYMPTLENVYSHKYPLSRFVYIYINKKPGQPIEPKTKEFLKMVLSKQGQQIVADERVYIPLNNEIVRAELAKLDSLD